MKGRSLLDDMCCWVLRQESACCWHCSLPDILLCLLLAPALMIDYIASASKPGSISIFPPQPVAVKCCHDDAESSILDESLNLKAYITFNPFSFLKLS